MINWFSLRPSCCRNEQIISQGLLYKVFNFIIRRETYAGFFYIKVLRRTLALDYAFYATTITIKYKCPVESPIMSDVSRNQNILIGSARGLC